MWDIEGYGMRGTIVYDKELEEQLVESCGKLLDIPLLVDELLPLLNVSPIVFLLPLVIF